MLFLNLTNLKKNRVKSFSFKFPRFFFLSEDNTAKFEAYSFRRFWVTQSQERDWSIFFERGFEGKKKKKKPVPDLEAEKPVELYKFKLSKNNKKKKSHFRIRHEAWPFSN